MSDELMSEFRSFRLDTQLPDKVMVLILTRNVKVVVSTLGGGSMGSPKRVRKYF